MGLQTNAFPGHLSAVVLYENLYCGKLAQHVFQQLHQARFNYSWNTSYWILNLLTISSVQSLVAQEIRQADVVVLVLEDENELSPAVVTCLLSGLSLATQPKAVVALLGFCAENDREVSPVKLQLKTLAGQVQKACWILRAANPQRTGEEPQYESEELMRTMGGGAGWSGHPG
jgi:hypothetical protein